MTFVRRNKRIPIIISCGSSKIETEKPVMAYSLYSGGFFKKVLKTAIHLSDSVFILSAGYGLLNLNYLILPYDIKITPKLAVYFRENRFFKIKAYYHLLSNTYEYSLTGNGKSLFYNDLSIGSKQNQLISLIGMKTQPLINLSALKPGKEKELMIIDKQKINRVSTKKYLEFTNNKKIKGGKPLGICKYIGDLFEKDFITMEKVNTILQNKFGEHCDYFGTIKRQIKEQSVKRNLQIKARYSGILNIFEYKYISMVRTK